MKVFTSKNLQMRPLAAQDQAMFCALYTDEKTMRFIEPAYSQEKAIKTFKSFVKKNTDSSSGFSTWAIVNKTIHISDISKTETEHLAPPAIGLVLLYNKAGNKELKITEVGILLLRQANGKLLAEEGLGAMLSYAFSQLHLPHVNARFDRRNLATKRITRKVGFSYHQNSADEVLSKSPKDNFNNKHTCLETISLNQWKNHALQYEITVKN